MKNAKLNDLIKKLDHNLDEDFKSISDKASASIYGGLILKNSNCNNEACSSGENNGCSNTSCTGGTSNSTCQNFACK